MGVDWRVRGSRIYRANFNKERLPRKHIVTVYCLLGVVRGSKIWGVTAKSGVPTAEGVIPVNHRFTEIPENSPKIPEIPENPGNPENRRFSPPEAPSQWAPLCMIDKFAKKQEKKWSIAPRFSFSKYGGGHFRVYGLKNTSGRCRTGRITSAGGPLVPCCTPPPIAYHKIAI